MIRPAIRIIGLDDETDVLAGMHMLVFDDRVIFDKNLSDPFCQCSVTALPAKVDGKDAIAFCNPVFFAYLRKPLLDLVPQCVFFHPENTLS